MKSRPANAILDGIEVGADSEVVLFSFENIGFADGRVGAEFGSAEQISLGQRDLTE
jgi:hypothetical protein